MPTFRQRFTGDTEEVFPAPPIARLLQPGDVVEYEADEPVEHARLELVPDEAPAKTRKAAAAASTDKEE